MEKTPLSMRKHIVIIGNTNSGKSTLFNLLLGQDVAIVSDVSGTTTDPVTKAMELIPFGPIALIDTAGFGDDSELGKQRIDKTEQLIKRADLILYVIDATSSNSPNSSNNSATITVYTKCELLSKEKLEELKNENPNAIFLSQYAREGIEDLKARMIEVLQKQNSEEETLIGDLLAEDSTVLLVTPIDSAAPKGRLILPQVQLIRDCLDHNIKAYITKENTLESSLSDLKRIDLVVTDSQVFSLVDRLVPDDIPLTSFSMLLARKKGNFSQYLEGAKALERLKSGDKILVLEGCTHNRTHEDIGRVKIPMLIEKKTGAKCEYTFATGYQFPDDLRDFDLVLSCGMCMINKKEVESRMTAFSENHIPVVNYGIAIAALNGILDRAKEIF